MKKLSKVMLIIAFMLTCMGSMMLNKNENHSDMKVGHDWGDQYPEPTGININKL